MARADILVSMVQSGMNSDMVSFRKSIEALIADEREKKHHILADKLARTIQNGAFINTTIKSVRINEDSKDLFFEIIPQKKFDDLVLDEKIFKVCKQLVEEQHRAEVLRSYGIEPRHRILLAGMPGNGKTSLAEAVAYELMYPLYVIRYENLIGSFLGETANRLQKVFDYVKTQRCVLFFDEFDTIGKERGDTKETGEIKRVVSSLLMQMDKLPSYVVVITASNHPELLDRAVWRRFQLKLELNKPTKQQIVILIEKLFSKSGIKLTYNINTLSEKIVGLSFAEIEEFYLDIIRQAVLQHKQDNVKSIVDETLKNWQNKFKIEKTV